jgi:hypothetical protein
MTRPPLRLALDVGTVMTRIAVDGPRPRLMTSDAPEGVMRDRVRAALRMAPRPADEICVALPDAWFSGHVPDAGCQEEVRYACEDEPGAERIIWAGQLAAVAAWHGRQRGPGRYLICDIGYAGVRTGSFTVTGGSVRTEMALSQGGGGWTEFDRAVRAVVDGDPLPGRWWEQAVAQADRAAQVFKNAAASPDHGDDRAYRLAGRREHRFTARQMMDCFAPTRDRLGTGISAVLGAGSPDTVVLTGGLGWFPLASQVVRDMVDLDPVVADPGTAVRGALLFARREVSVEIPAGLGEVSLPMNRVRDGFLEEEGLELPWAEPFASPPAGMPPLHGEELVLMISGQYRTVRLPGLVPGPYRIGVRPGWSGSGVLVVRPAVGDSAHIVSLDATATP